MNPGVARLAVVIALVVGGVAVLANGFSDAEPVAAPGDSPTPSPSRSPTPSRAPQQPAVANKEGVLVQVLNGTSVAGYAADFQGLLEDEGYLPAGDASDAPEKPVIDSVVYFRPDGNAAQNRADAELLSKDYLGGVVVKRLPAALEGAVSESADVVVVLGEDQAGLP